MAQEPSDAQYLDEPYTGSYLPIDTAGLIASMPNWKGKPTIYSDDKGNVKGVYTFNGVVPVESLNPLVRKGEPITANTLVQEVGEGGAKLYLRDPTDPESKTYENTGIPSIAGTVAQQAFVPPRNNSAFGPILSDFAAAARDPYFHKFLAGAAALGGAGLALNSIYGVGGLGAGAVSSPVALGGAIPATELGAAAGTGAGAAGAGGVGSTVGVTGAGECLAADAAASLAGQGAFDAAASLGMPLEQAVSQGLITGSGTLTDAGAAALMGGEATAGISPLKALRIANLARSGLSTLASGFGGAGTSGLSRLAGPAALAAAIAAARAGQRGGGSGNEAVVPTQTLDWGYQYTPNERPGVAMSQQYLNPRFFQEGGLSSLEKEQRVIPTDVMDEIRNIVNDVDESDKVDAYNSLLQNIASRQAPIIPRFNYQPSVDNMPTMGAGNIGATIPVGQGAINADIYGSRMSSPNYRRDGVDAIGMGYEMPLAGGTLSANINKPLRGPGVGGMLNYERRFAVGGDIGKSYSSPDDGGVPNSNMVGAHAAVNMGPQFPMQGMYQGYAQGGLSDLGGYSDGGRMLKGPGDGMSDSIPASIENKRPARLATDEFVVPADVVSHLGNGSSDAGAKVLYSMMDRVRQARTGQKKQGKQINPNKFMPV